jgi:Tol biopolymer transport system component
VAFTSAADNLVADDTNRMPDAFVRDMRTGTETCVSVGSGGKQSPSGAYEGVALSADGRYAAFVSGSPLTPDAGGHASDVYVRDLVAATTTRVSVGADHVYTDAFDPSISADGRLVAFVSYAPLIPAALGMVGGGVYVWDMVTGSLQLASLAGNGEAPDNDSAGAAAISANGRFVGFTSAAEGLVPGDTNGARDVFVRDLTLGTTKRVSIAPDGSQFPTDCMFAGISADGQAVSFAASIVLDFPWNHYTSDFGQARALYIRNLKTGVTTLINVSSAGTVANDHSSVFAPLTADGKYVAFDSFGDNLVPGDTNGDWDIFLRGPLFSTAPGYTAADAARALRIASGLTMAAPEDIARLNLEQSDPAVTLADAVTIARHITGNL